MTNALAALGILLPLVWIVASLVAVALVTRRRILIAPRPPAVSVLKPLCGVDADLEENLESFFVQDHPDLEIVLGVRDAGDAALPVARRVAARHPNVASRIVVHDGRGALNPKVDNLLGIMDEARHDLVLISDSNVRAPAHYVRELASLYAERRPGLITNLFAGTGENSLGSALANVELSGFCAAGAALPTLAGDALVVGKSMFFSRQRLRELGGLERFSHVLAEDFVMGKTFAHAGERVLVAPTVLANVTRGARPAAVFRRHLRWAMLRCRLRPTAALLEPLVSPLLVVPLGWGALGAATLPVALLLLALRDVGGWLLLRGRARWYVPLALGPLREIQALVVWAVAPFKRQVSWRGKRYRLSAGTLLYAQEGESRPRPPRSERFGLLRRVVIHRQERRETALQHELVQQA